MQIRLFLYTMKHRWKILIMILLCNCKQQESHPPCSSRLWKPVNIISQPTSIIQQNIQEVTFGDTVYEWKDTNNTFLEAGSYVYDSEAQIITCTPSGTSFITKKPEIYQMQAVLTDQRLILTYQKADTTIIFELEKNCP